MAKQVKDEMLSFLGKMWEIVKAIFDEVKNLGGGFQDIIRAGSDPELRKSIAALVMSGGRTDARIQVSPKDARVLLAPWHAFYKKWFGMRQDWRIIDVVIPSRPAKGAWRLIVVLKGLTLNRVFTTLQNHFDCSSWTDNLEKAVIHNERDSSSGSYAIWVEDCKEANPVLKHLSADDLVAQGIPCETLMERLLHEGIVFEETDTHLDTDTVTLCAGSRYSDGNVPCVDWDDGKLDVGRYTSDFAYDNLRARAVVS